MNHSWPLAQETVSGNSSGWLAWLGSLAGQAREHVFPLLTNPLLWAIPLAAASLFLLLPRGTRRQWAVGAVLGGFSLGLFAAAFPLSGALADRLVFWLLALIAVGGAAAAISMRNAVYSAIWFALSLLGVAGLFVYQGAQFLGVVTIVIYAGAIVVTFLFVLMLAQPQGHAVYDRLGWGAVPKVLSVATSALLVGVLSFLLAHRPATPRDRVAEVLLGWRDSSGHPALRADQIVAVQTGGASGKVRLVFRGDLSTSLLDRVRTELLEALATQDPAQFPVGARLDIEFLPTWQDVLHADHMAHLGRDLFSRHLVSVEIAGTLLLAALVGAVAIVIQGNAARPRSEGSGE